LQAACASGQDVERFHDFLAYTGRSEVRLFLAKSPAGSIFIGYTIVKPL
jgi:hypothetical protein